MQGVAQGIASALGIKEKALRRCGVEGDGDEFGALQHQESVSPTGVFVVHLRGDKYLGKIPCYQCDVFSFGGEDFEQAVADGTGGEEGVAETQDVLFGAVDEEDGSDAEVVYLLIAIDGPNS